MELENIQLEAVRRIQDAKSLDELEIIRVDYLSKKGSLTAAMQKMKDLPNEEKPLYGKKVNEVKEEIQNLLKSKQSILQEIALNEKLVEEKIDVTLPGLAIKRGVQNPLILVQREVESLFKDMGYQIIEGDEVELDLYNFERANIPEEHPAREMQDTFYINEESLLRTHTTAIQVRVLEEMAPKVPVKVICPGKVYRRDEDDATHSHQFVQMEGLVVGEGVTLSDLKGTLSLFAKHMFGEERVIRFRPSYFQFTEPSVEIDVTCHNCNGSGCNICKQTGWIEILGGGMVHPNVLKMAGYTDPKLSGFAFGIGIERISMLKYGIDDIRSFYTNDQRFLDQFKRYE